MIKKDWDVIVAGGGIAGLTITALFSKLGLKVLCIEPIKPACKAGTKGSDLRSTAYLLNSIKLFEDIGVWNDLQKHSEKLRIMRICTSEDSHTDQFLESRFDSNDLNLPYFGYNIPNWFTKEILLSLIDTFQDSKVIFGSKAAHLMSYLDRSCIKLTNNCVVSSKLIIGADGRGSNIRTLSNIKIKKWDNAQDAIACIAKHEKSHEEASIEILQSGGPCTLVPLKNTINGEFQSAVVWMEERVHAKKLMLLNDHDFSTELSQRTKHILGNCKLNSRRTIYPIITQVADEFFGNRMALIAEAAHVMPPIGAQGLNTSFDDISLLVKLVKTALEKKNDIGTPELLREYGTIRRRLTLSKIFGVTLLNNVSKSNLAFTQSLRKVGLAMIDKNLLLKKTLMKTGLGRG